MEKIIRAMMDLIASEVCGKEIDKSQQTLTDEELAKLYKLSKSHDLAHLVGDALIKNDLIEDGEIKAKFQKQIMLAVYRYEKINYELGRLRKVLNEAEIPFMPLKGSVLRKYYLMSTEQVPNFCSERESPEDMRAFSKERAESCGDSAPEQTRQAHGRQSPAVSR